MVFILPGQSIFRLPLHSHIYQPILVVSLPPIQMTGRRRLDGLGLSGNDLSRENFKTLGPLSGPFEERKSLKFFGSFKQFSFNQKFLHVQGRIWKIIQRPEGKIKTNMALILADASSRIIATLVCHGGGCGTFADVASKRILWRTLHHDPDHRAGYVSKTVIEIDSSCFPSGKDDKKNSA